MSAHSLKIDDDVLPCLEFIVPQLDDSSHEIWAGEGIDEVVTHEQRLVAAEYHMIVGWSVELFLHPCHDIRHVLTVVEIGRCDKIYLIFLKEHPEGFLYTASGFSPLVGRTVGRNEYDGAFTVFL